MNDIVKAWEDAGSPHPYSTFQEGYRAALQSQDREALVHLRVPAETKARWVRESRAAGMRLTD